MNAFSNLCSFYALRNYIRKGRSPARFGCRHVAFNLPNAAGARDVTYLRPAGPLDCSDGQVLHDWCLAGYGIAWRSTWQVEAEIASGKLAALLEDFAARRTGFTRFFRSVNIWRCEYGCGLTF